LAEAFNYFSVFITGNNPSHKFLFIGKEVQSPGMKTSAFYIESNRKWIDSKYNSGFPVSCRLPSKILTSPKNLQHALFRKEFWGKRVV